MNDDALTRLRCEKIGFVFQSFNLLPTLTAKENVLLPAKLAGKYGKELDARADELLGRVGLSAGCTTDRTSFRAAKCNAWPSLAR